MIDDKEKKEKRKKAREDQILSRTHLSSDIDFDPGTNPDLPATSFSTRALFAPTDPDVSSLSTPFTWSTAPTSTSADVDDAAAATSMGKGEIWNLNPARRMN